MKTKIISIKELLKNNERFCLSVNRMIDKCYDCELYKNCESKITNKKYETKIKKITKLESEIKKLKKELKEL